MNWLPARNRNYVNTQLKDIDNRLSKLEREIKSLTRFIKNPRLKKKGNNLNMITKPFGHQSMSDSKRRFVSYLTTGSFQTISLRKHEQRTAKIKTALLLIAVATFVFLILYGIIRNLFF